MKIKKNSSCLPSINWPLSGNQFHLQRPKRSLRGAGALVCTGLKSASCSTFCFGRVMRQFLVEAERPVESLQIDCSVKEQSGSPGIFENIGSHLGQDIDIFNASNVLCRVQMVPKNGGKWVCKNFAKVKKIISST